MKNSVIRAIVGMVTIISLFLACAEANSAANQLLWSEIGKASFKKFPFPTKKHKIPLSRFFFGTRGAKKKLGKKKAPLF